MKCIVCGEEIDKNENEFFAGGYVTIHFSFGSKNDTEEWKGEVHDSCVRIIQKFMTKSDYM